MAEWHFGLYSKTPPMVSYARRVTILFFPLLIVIVRVPFTVPQPVSYDYPNFNHTYVEQPVLEGEASIVDSDSVIRITGKPHNGSGVGRVTIPKHVQLWDKISNELNDFTTKFSFVIFSNETYFGDGLAFFLASPDLPKALDIGGGGGFGILPENETVSTEYSFVAVEFDTHTNTLDPDGTHVGVDINSVRSNRYLQWMADISQRIVYNCTIEYSSRENHLNVSFTGHSLNEGMVHQHFSYHIDLRENLPEYVIVGITASTGLNREEHTLLSWSFSTSPPSNDDDPKKGSKFINNRKLLEGIGIGVGLALSLTGLILTVLWNVNKEKEEESPTSDTISDLRMDDEFIMSIGPKKINYYELATATNNFEETQKLGQGGFGGVYKGYFRCSNSFAAIKKISADSKQGIKQYAAEVKIISQLRHRNLVKLTGWCHKRTELILIYEYMPNGSLDSHLFRGKSVLSWEVRYNNIVRGLASALLYLQEEWEKCVIHRDIKSSNIMLDSNFNAKLGDFGLATLVDHEKGAQTTDVAGTMGYLDPEYINTGKAGKESDIFSFGVVLLEVATGRKASHHHDMEGQVSLVEWVWELYEFRNLMAAADPNLCGAFNVQQMELVLVVGLWCANPDFKSRPCIRKVIKVLNFEASLPILPQKMPHLALRSPTTNEHFISVSSSFSSVSLELDRN
ncbi:L-type lectin-domain containing receptor kinase IX.1-like [Lotus japonicus]|uniref:L-type lectin-domain containing receptor kinase IX.1-like n=1 Tax=Lotus japonicus TaxID=34305 RepID=UPI002590290A|nr:L-type lectin-domain containing receptor kinase IX.1-like [Lotus japonicus]